VEAPNVNDVLLPLPLVEVAAAAAAAVGEAGLEVLARL
jgi:hypothetical protein